MIFGKRRKLSSRWPYLTAAFLAGAAAYVVLRLFFRDFDSLTDDQVREVEAFEEYERRQRGGPV
jgi:hypothetical protein